MPGRGIAAMAQGTIGPMTDRDAGATGEPAPPASATANAMRLLPLVLPGIVVGIGSAFLLIVVSGIANWLEAILWTTLPAQLGVDPAGPLWIVGMLTLTGLAVGLVVTFVPGHAGPDPATVELAGPPLPLPVLPGLAIALILGLAGGVSLGPENPIIGIATGLSVAIGLRVLPRVPAAAWSGLAFAGMVGAMFGTPVGAALLLSESLRESGQRMWDRLFGPLVAAAAGALTMALLTNESFVLTIVPYVQPQAIDLVTGSLVAMGAAALGLVSISLFPLAYAAFQRLRHPIPMLVVGGFLLGLLGVIGGPISLFKGLDQMKELTATVGDYTPAGLALLAVVKLVAVVIASTSGFRGGRIFPAVFAGVAIGLFANAAFPQIPEAIAVSAALVGILVAVTRSGWMAIFMGGLMVNDPAIVPILAIIVLPAWLVVTGRPEMVIRKPHTEAATA
jgi:H+/Cl- antiporter ClcA